MYDYQREFLDLAIACKVLRFGEFTLKSGRVSPYFFNAGLFDSGAALYTLGRAYAEAAIRSGIAFDMLFGPAYKGITLATATAIALAHHHGKDLPFAFNRKEAKNHGEGGMIVGASLQGRILIVDDVITVGTAIRESIALIHAHNAQVAGILIALDREERGRQHLSAVQEITEEFGIPVIAIARLTELLTYTQEQPDLRESHTKLQAYRHRYGV